MIAERTWPKPKKPTKNCNTYYPTNNSKRNNEPPWEVTVNGHANYHECCWDSGKDIGEPFFANCTF